MQVEPTPPQDLDVEATLLGGLLTADRFDNNLVYCDLDEVRSIVGPDAFCLPEHRRVFQAIIHTDDAGDPLDRIAVAARLQASESTANWDDELHHVMVAGDAANDVLRGPAPRSGAVVRRQRGGRRMSLRTQHPDQHGATREPMRVRAHDAVRMLGISPRTLWGLRDLPRVKIGRSVRYDMADLRKRIESRKSA